MSADGRERELVQFREALQEAVLRKLRDDGSMQTQTPALERYLRRLINAEKLQFPIELRDVDGEIAEAVSRAIDDLRHHRCDRPQGEQIEEQSNEALKREPAPLGGREFNPPYMPAIVQEYLALVGPTTSAARVFHYASFMTIASIALGPFVSLENNPRFHPNLYTLLAGPSRFSHKSTAIDYAIDGVLKHMGVERCYDLRGVVSIEGLATKVEVKENPRILVVEDELVNLFAMQARGASSNIIPRLCELYGMKPRFELNSKNAVVLINPFVCFLGGVTRECLNSREARVAAQLGFFNRCWVVCGSACKPLPQWTWPASGLDYIAQKFATLYAALSEHRIVCRYSPAAAQRRETWLDDWFETAITRANAGELFNPETNNLLLRFEMLAAALDQTHEIRPEHTEHAIAVLTATELDALGVMTIKPASRDRDCEEWCEQHIPIGRTSMRNIERMAHKVVAMNEVLRVLRTWQNLARADVLDSEGKRGPRGKDVARFW